MRVAAGGDVAFHPARPLSSADLATVTQRVRRRLVRWFRRKGFLSREAAADMLTWQHSRFSVDASVRIVLADRDVPGYFLSLEHLLRYCARPAFALDRLSVVPGTGHRPERIRYTLPRHKRGNWVGPGRTRKSTRPWASGVIELTPLEFLDRLAALIPPPRRHRHRYHGVFAPNHPLRQAVTALAVGNIGKQRDAKTGEHEGRTGRPTGLSQGSHPSGTTEEAISAAFSGKSRPRLPRKRQKSARRSGLMRRMLRYCARPAFALNRLSVVSATGYRPERVRYSLPRHKRGSWVCPERSRKSTRPGASGFV